MIKFKEFLVAGGHETAFFFCAKKCLKTAKNQACIKVAQPCGQKIVYYYKRVTKI